MDHPSSRLKSWDWNNSSAVRKQLVTEMTMANSMVGCPWCSAMLLIATELNKNVKKAF